MAAYVITLVNYKDTGWVEKYREVVPKLIAAHGGRYLARARPPERIEGEGKMPQTMMIVEFPTVEAARAVFECEEYRPLAEARIAGGGETTIFIADGVNE